MARGLELRFALDGKIAVVTGGGAGIGQHISLTLAEAGAAVVVQDLNGDNAQKVSQQIQNSGGRSVALSGDITESATIQKMLDSARQDLGGLDILVNNAGIYPFAPFLDIPITLWDQVVNVNVRATFQCTQLAGKMMSDAGKGGCIVNLASIQGFKPSTPMQGCYDTTKAAIIMLTKAAALELAPFKIRVNAIAPGIVETQGTKPFIDSGALDSMLARIPLSRFGRPDDIANLALYLVSPAAEYVTGETVVIDGGFLLT